MTNNKNKEFVPYEKALVLKELGFNEPCLASYFHAGKRLHITEYLNYGEYTTLAPTFSQAFRWFRDKHKLGAIISQFGWGIENELGQIVHNISDSENPLCYEEAELECLKKLIEIVKLDNNDK